MLANVRWNNVVVTSLHGKLFSREIKVKMIYISLHLSLVLGQNINKPTYPRYVQVHNSKHGFRASWSTMLIGYDYGF